jgi:hypothetical protein
MKDVLINKFRVKYEGVYYGPGQEAGNVIHDLPDKIADPLIAESMGRIVDITRYEPISSRGKKKKAEVAQVAESDDEEGGIPGIDPDKTVKSK